MAIRQLGIPTSLMQQPIRLIVKIHSGANQMNDHELGGDRAKTQFSELLQARRHENRRVVPKVA